MQMMKQYQLFSLVYTIILLLHGSKVYSQHHHAHSEHFNRIPSEFFHIVNAEIVDTGSSEHPWRQAHESKRRLDTISDSDLINNEHNNFEQTIFPSHHTNPPYGETITLNIHVKCRDGMTKVKLDKLKLNHHKELIHEDAVLEYMGKDGVRKNMPVPNTVYYHYNKERKLWVHVSIVDQDNFHALIHKDGKAYVVEPNAMHPESGMAGVSHDKSKEGRIHHRRLKEFYERHQNTYGIEPTLIAFEGKRIEFPSYDIMSENRKLIYLNDQGEPVEMNHNLKEEDINNVKAVEVVNDERNGRKLYGMSFKPIPGNYDGPYSRIHSDCPATLHMMHVVYGVDTGFFKKVTGFTSESGSATTAQLQSLSALLSSICATSNLVYSQQLNLVSRIRRIVAFSDASVGPQQGPDVNTNAQDWNQEPLDVDVTGSNRGQQGCEISRNNYDANSGSITTSNGDTDYLAYLKSAGLWWSDRDADKNSGSEPSGVFSVFTNCFPSPGTVGLAYVGTLCKQSMTNVGWTNGGRSNSAGTWEVYAHELGHNVGAGHTTTGLMSYNTVPEFKFSDQKVNNNPSSNFESICETIKKVKDENGWVQSNCLHELTSNCNNGILDYNEECDPSVSWTDPIEPKNKFDSSRWCDSSCKFKNGKQCNPFYRNIKSVANTCGTGKRCQWCKESSCTDLIGCTWDASKYHCSDGSEDNVESPIVEYYLNDCCDSDGKFVLPSLVRYTAEEGNCDLGESHGRKGICINGACRNLCRPKNAYAVGNYWWTQCVTTSTEKCKTRCRKASWASCAKEDDADVESNLPAGTVCNYAPYSTCTGSGVCQVVTNPPPGFGDTPSVVTTLAPAPVVTTPAPTPAPVVTTTPAPAPNCDCLGLTAGDNKKNGDDCGKWGYSYAWCYTVDSKCGTSSTKNWKECVIPVVDDPKDSNCECKNGDKAGETCGKWGYDENWCYTVGTKCGPDGKSNWKECIVTTTPDCSCIDDDAKAGNKCDYWGYDTAWCYTKDTKNCGPSKNSNWKDCVMDVKQNDCVCKGGSTAGNTCAKWGYDDKWCYTKGNTCGPDGKSNWINCHDDSTPIGGARIEAIPPPTGLAIVQPTRGTVWLAGNDHTIQWNSQNISRFETFNIRLFKEEAGSFTQFQPFNPSLVINNSQSFRFRLSAGYFQANDLCRTYKLKLVSESDMHFKDTLGIDKIDKLTAESKPFTINDSPVFIQDETGIAVSIKDETNTNAVSIITKGESYTLSGDTTCTIKKLKIDLYKNNTFVYNIRNSLSKSPTANSWSFNWVVPMSEFNAGESYKIKVSDLNSNAERDSSYFRIQNNPIVDSCGAGKSDFTVFLPNTKTAWQQYDDVLIQWGSNGCPLTLPAEAKFKVLLIDSKDELVDDIGCFGPFGCEVTGTQLKIQVDPKWGSGPGYKIEVKSIINQEIEATSSKFEIVRRNSITIAKLEKKEFFVGDDISFSWDYHGLISHVDIELLNSEGDAYRTLASHWPNTKRFTFKTNEYNYMTERSLSIRVVEHGGTARGNSRQDNKNTAFGVSEKFALQPKSESRLEVDYPTANEVWKNDTNKKNVEWLASRGGGRNELPELVDIILCTKNGAEEKVVDTLYKRFILNEGVNSKKVQIFDKRLVQSSFYVIKIQASAKDGDIPRSSKVQDLVGVSEPFRIIQPSVLQVVNVLPKGADLMLENPFTIKWISYGAVIESVDILLRACTSMMDKVCIGKEIKIATNIQNQHSYTVMASYEIVPEISYQAVVHATGDSRLRSAYPLGEGIRFHRNPNNSSEIKIIEPHANSAISVGGNILLQWTGAAAYDDAAIRLEKRENGDAILILEKYVNDPTGFYIFPIPSSLKPGVRFAISISTRVPGCSNCLVNLTKYSEEFSIGPAVNDIIGVSSIIPVPHQISGINVDVTKLVPAFGRRFKWYTKAQVGVAALELWRCVTKDCLNVKYAITIETVDTSNQNFTNFEHTIDYTVPWTTPPLNDKYYIVVARSLSYPDTYFYIHHEDKKQFQFQAGTNLCIKTDSGSDCTATKVLLKVDTPGESGAVELGKTVEVTWKFSIVTQPNEWSPPTIVTVSLWKKGKLLQVLADEIPNTGKFNWGVDASAESQNELSDNDGYTIQVNGIAYTEPWNRIVSCPNQNLGQQENGCFSSTFKMVKPNGKSTSNDVQLIAILERKNLLTSKGWSLVSSGGNYRHDDVLSAGDSLKLKWSSFGLNNTRLSAMLFYNNQGIMYFFDDGGSAGERAITIPKTINNLGKVDIPVSYPASSYEIVFFYTPASYLGNDEITTLSAIPTGSIVGRTVKFKMSSYRTLNLEYRSNVVKGSTFNIIWEDTNTPSLIGTRVLRRKVAGGKKKYIGVGSRRLLSSIYENSKWQTVQGVPCVPFQWENRMHYECTSGPQPQELNGKSWCATKVDPSSKLPVEYDLCPKRMNLGQATQDVVNSAGRFLRWKVSDDLASGENYYVQLLNAFTGEVIARTNEFNVGCSSIEVKYYLDSNAQLLGKDAIQKRIVSSTKLPSDAVNMIEINRDIVVGNNTEDEVIVQMITLDKEIEADKCPLKRLNALANDDHVQASSITYTTLDRFSEPPPEFNTLKGITKENLLWLILGIVFGFLVIVSGIYACYRYRKRKEEVAEVFGQWRAARMDARKTYFVNKKTGETSWMPPKRKSSIKRLISKSVMNHVVNPLQAAAKAPESKIKTQEGELPDGWHDGKTETGRTYYWHDDNVSTSWEKPDWIPEGWDKDAQYDDNDVDEEDEQGLLPGWHVGYTEDAHQQKFYYHDDNVSTSWELPDWVPENWKPDNNFFAGAVTTEELPDGWEAIHTGGTEDGKLYYYNEKTCETTWKNPNETDRVEL